MSLLAQDTPTQPGATPTLHVYTNLVQIPVLVLDSWRNKLSSPIAQNRFSFRIDDGPWHRPSYARPEADDPIDLSIVLDTRSAPEGLVERIDQTIAGLAPSFLHPQDHVSIYSIDCSTLGFVEDVTADSGPLKRAVDTALNTWTARRQKIKSLCNQDSRLWDTLSFVTNKLSAHSGRRVVLAITDGHDKKSKNSLTDVANMAQTAGVTIFALDPSWNGRPGFLPADDIRLSNACELTGGLMLNPSFGSAAKIMQRFTQMLRERYILEFPQPPDVGAGAHKMSVKVDKLEAFIRVSGNSVPLGHSTQIADTSTVPSEQATPPATKSISADPVPLPEDRPPTVAAVTPQPAVVVSQPHPSTTTEAQQPPVSGTMPLKVVTKLTVEDVTVSDDHHKPVHGLQQSDFVVKEDGKPQTIRNFEELGDDKPSPQPAPLQLPPNTYTNAQATPPNTKAVNILMLDSITTCPPSDLSKCLEYMVYPRDKAINYLNRMPPGTQVAIFKLENDLHLIQGVTTDKAVLLAAMNTTGFKLPPVNNTRPLVSIEDLCDRLNDRSRAVLNALEQQAAYLSGIKGRKSLIWFTRGIPWLTNYSDYSKRARCLADYRERLHRAYGLLNAAQIALYPIDPRGPGVQLPDPGYDSMQDLAKATGGVAYIGRNDIDSAIEEAIATGSDYYSLSYVPPLSKYDGQYHKIDVNVDRPHLNLQYRVGYTSIDLSKAPSPSEPSSKDSSKPVQPPLSVFDVAMGHGATPSTQMLFNVSITPSTAPAKPGDPVIGTLDPRLKGKSLVRYDVSFALPADQITLEEEPDGTCKMSMQFVIAAYDAEGKMLNYHGQTAKAILKPEQVARFKQQPLPMKMQIDLPAGKIFVRAGLLDVTSQKTGSLEVPETVVK